MRGFVRRMSHDSSMTAALAELPRVTGRHRNLGLAAVRRARAVELMASGCTYQQVADKLGYTSRGTAHNIVAKALKDQTAEAVGSLRDLETARLDALQLALWDAAMTGDVKAATAIVLIVRAWPGSI
jgi:hypothetical protein